MGIHITGIGCTRGLVGGWIAVQCRNIAIVLCVCLKGGGRGRMGRLSHVMEIEDFAYSA